MLDNLKNLTNQTKEELIANETTPLDNLTESESLEQDGVLVVNISTDNILNLDELYPNIHISSSVNKVDEVTNKIQSNSREITGDSNNNIKMKSPPENVTIGAAPTNGDLSTNEEDEDSSNLEKAVVNKTEEDLDGKFLEANDLFKPTESLQSLVLETTSKRRRRRRRHGNGRRYDYFMV